MNPAHGRCHTCGQPLPTRRFDLGPLTLLVDVRRAFWRGIYVPLSTMQYMAVERFAKAEGAIVTNDQLAERQASACDVAPKTVDAHVCRARKAFLNADETFDRIETIYGVGYRWRP